jgi:hypothetical protein
MNSGSVSTLAPRYLGAKTTARRNMNTKAYQPKLPATTPVVYPILAEAMSMEGPTFVPHMVNPILPHSSECPARNKFSLLFLFLMKLTQ